MERFSVWQDNSCSDFSNVIHSLSTFHERAEQQIDHITGRTLTKKVDLIGETNSFESAGCVFNYQLFEIIIEELSQTYFYSPEEKKRIETFNCEGAVILYNEKIYYIAFRGETSLLKKNLRLVLNHDTNGTLSPFELIDKKNDDFFYWIFNKHHNEKHKEIDEEYSIRFLDLVAFKGKAENSSTVSSSGSRILEILSTLAFIFENEKFISITTEIGYLIKKDNHSRMTINLSQSGTHYFDEQVYEGEHLFNTNGEHDKAMIVKALCEYIFIIHPKIYEAFQEDERQGLWSKAAKLVFIRSLGADIQSRVDALAESIENEIKDLNEEE